MKKQNLIFFLLAIVILLLSGNLLKAQTSVYVCSTNGSYGFCYGNSNVPKCAYNKCIEYGGETPYPILFVLSKGYGAIVVGRLSNGAQVVGAAAGYQTQQEAINRARRECINRGGQNVYTAYTFLDR